MAIFFPDLLLLLVDYTNITSIVVIIFCSVGMTIFIYLYRTVDFRPHQRNMVKVSNPFVLDLDDTTVQFGDDVKFNLSTLCPCHVVVMWGPRIQALHNLILVPGRMIRKKMLTDVKQNTDLQPLHSDLLRFDVEGKHSFSLSTPKCVTSRTFGEVPRTRYPLAVFIFSPGKAGNERDGDVIPEEEEEKDNTIIGLFVIVHLKDKTVTKDSHIIAKYVKTAGVPLYSLQALFVSSTDKQQQGSTSVQRRSTQPVQCNNHSYGHSISPNLRYRNASNLSSSTNCADCEQVGCLSASNGSSVGHMNQVVLSEDPVDVEANENNDNAYSNIKQEKCSSSKSGDNAHLINHAQSDGSFGICNGTSNTGTTFDEESDVLNHQRASKCCSSDTDDLLQYNVSKDDSTSSNPIPDCVVCQTYPAKCALLPCRHNCVCLHCLRLLDKCPMCRGVLESYFLVFSRQDEGFGDEDEDGDIEEDEIEAENERVIRQGIAEQVENMFERVNQIVGFA